MEKYSGPACVGRGRSSPELTVCTALKRFSRTLQSSVLPEEQRLLSDRSRMTSPSHVVPNVNVCLPLAFKRLISDIYNREKKRILKHGLELKKAFGFIVWNKICCKVEVCYRSRPAIRFHVPALHVFVCNTTISSCP